MQPYYIRQVSHVCDGTTFVIGGFMNEHVQRVTIDLRTSAIGNTGGQWSVEERNSLQLSVPQDGRLECIMLITNTHIRVAFNGIHHYDFRHRIPKENISEIIISDGIRVTNVGVYGPGVTEETCTGFQCLVNVPPVPGSTLLPYSDHAAFHSGPVITKEIIGGLYDGRHIYIHGIPGSSRFTINVRYQKMRGNIALHLTAQMQNQLFIRNAYVNGVRGPEETMQPYFPFAPGYPFSMIIRCEHDRFKVAVNGAHLFDFAHRDRNLPAIQCIEVLDDVINVQVDVPPQIGRFVNPVYG